MTIPDPLMPAAIAGGVLGNLATKIVEHHLPKVEGTRLGVPLRWIGLIHADMKEYLPKAVQYARACFYERHPQYAVTGLTRSWRDERVSVQIAGAVLHGKPTDTEAFAEALRQ